MFKTVSYRVVPTSLPGFVASRPSQAAPHAAPRWREVRPGQGGCSPIGMRHALRPPTVRLAANGHGCDEVLQPRELNEARGVAQHERVRYPLAAFRAAIDRRSWLARTDILNAYETHLARYVEHRGNSVVPGQMTTTRIIQSYLRDLVAHLKDYESGVRSGEYTGGLEEARALRAAAENQVCEFRSYPKYPWV
jgi:hypothetical protein